MTGMNIDTGRQLDGLDHLRQSITDILTTPIGSRVMRRDYGADVFDLIDAPMTSATLIDLYAASAVALDKWEPRFRLTHVQCHGITEDGKTSLALKGAYLPEGREITLEGIVL